MFNFLAKARALGASDVHLAAGKLPMVRVHGLLQPCGDKVVSQTDLEKKMRATLNEQLFLQLQHIGELDTAFSDAAGRRYRLNVYREDDGYAVAVRLLAERIPSCAELGLPESVEQLAQLERGLVLVTGATGSGKSTTLAALVQKINSTRSWHVLTLEDPIEYVYPQEKAFITQREVGRDTESFASGLRSALRQDPDVILVGELRDAETMAIALTAAETGHLVLATLHTQDASSCVTRLLELAPERQQQLRAQLAECLQAVVCQRLLPRADVHGRIAAFEVLIATAALRNLIRDGYTHQLASYIQTGKQYGMVTMADYIAMLKKKGIVQL